MESGLVVLAYVPGVQGWGGPVKRGSPQSQSSGLTLEIDRLGEFIGGFAGVLVGATLGLAAAQTCSHGQDTAKQPDSYDTDCYGEQ